MLVSLLLIIASGTGAGFVAGTIASSIFSGASKTAGRRRDLKMGVQCSSLILGGFASGGTAAMLAFDSGVPLTIEAGFWIVGGTFAFTLAESLCRLKCATIFHPQAVESGELSLLGGVVLLAGLHLLGVLWVTLIIVGAGTILTASLLAGQKMCGYL